MGEDLADRLDAFLGGRTMSYREAGQALGVHPSQFRYAAPTGRVIIRWDGARSPTIWTVPPPRSNHARHDSSSRVATCMCSVPPLPKRLRCWAGIAPRSGIETFDTLRRSLTPVRTPIGDAWILTGDEPALLAPPGPAAPARLLPSGDSYFLLQGEGRDLLVPEADRRQVLWTSRVWPGAVLVGGEIVGTWRRARDTMTSRGVAPAVPRRARGGRGGSSVFPTARYRGASRRPLG